jgi:hypothetical protein
MESMNKLSLCGTVVSSPRFTCRKDSPGMTFWELFLERRKGFSYENSTLLFILTVPWLRRCVFAVELGASAGHDTRRRSLR